MRIIDADKFLEYLIFSKHIDSLKCAEVKEAVKMCEVEQPTVCDIDQIRAEIDRLHYHPKLDFIKNDDVVEMALEIIDRHTKGANECGK